MKLASISVRGLRCLASVEDVAVGSPTIVTGSNDGGKSTLLLALRFLLNDWTPTHEDRTIEGSDDEGNVHRSTEIVVEGTFHPCREERDALESGEEIIVRRRFSSDGTSVYEWWRLVPSDIRLRGLGERSLGQLRELASDFGLLCEGNRSVKKTFLEPLDEFAKRSDQVLEWDACPQAVIERLPRCLRFDQEDPEAAIRELLTNVYRETMKRPHVRDQIADVERTVAEELAASAEKLRVHLSERCHDLPAITIEPNVAFREQFPSVRITAGATPDRQVALDAAGSGRRRRMALAASEFANELVREGALPDSGLVVLYDEPDTHLDYHHQRRLVDVINGQAAMPAVTVVVVTHSMNLIDRVPIENVIHLQRRDGLSAVEQLGDDADAFLANVAQELGLRTSVLLHERCLVLVEGETEELVFPLLFKAATGMSIQSAGVAFVSAGGNAGALMLFKYLVDRNRIVRVVVDADTFHSSTNDSLRQSALEAATLTGDQMLRCVGEAELEDLFSDEQWAEAANKEWPRKDGQSWTPVDFKPCRDPDKKFSKAIDALIGRHAAHGQRVSKPTRLMAVARLIHDRDGVPSDLADVFDELVDLGRP